MEVGSTKVSKGEHGSRKIGVTKVGVTKIGITEFGEVADAEVRPYFRMLFPPLIPNISSLFEYIKMFLVCHTTYLR